MSQETSASTTEAQIKDKRRISPLWLLPSTVLMTTGWLIWNSYQDRGSTVTVDFISADGIVSGRTLVHYQGVEVGTVQDISLSDDLYKIEVKVSIKSGMEDALREETQFWLVIPKASLAGISGLDALVGGNYIGMMPGKGKKQDHFVILGTQPKYRLDNGDLMIHLRAPDLDSLNSGPLVYSRKIPVGKVYDYAINPNKQGVVIDILIERRLIDLVKKGSRFQNVPGIGVNVSVSGMKVELGSLAILVNGAIVFDSPEELKPAEAEDALGLYEDLAHSQHGVIIKLELPSGAGLAADSTPLMYQGLGVGQLAELDLGPGGKATGEMAADLSVVILLREDIRIELCNPKSSLSDTNLSALLTGKTFKLVPGGGEPRKGFVVMPSGETLLHKPDILVPIPTAPESYGADAGQSLILHGVQIGQVTDRKLTSKGVTFTVVVEPQHRELVKGDSKSVVNSHADVEVGPDGVEFFGASASGWINSGIRILPGDKGKMKVSYPLYTNLGKALENSLGDLPTTTVSLGVEALSGVQAGSVVLYRKLEVGEIIAVRPRANVFDIDLHIKPEYRNLLTSNSVFQAEGGVRVQLNGSGLTVQASLLFRASKGTISFDNLSGVSTSQRKGDKRILYTSETATRAVGEQITLHVFDTGKPAIEMPIRYLGIDIEQIQTLDLTAARNEIQARTALYPECVQTFACGGMCFSVATPQIPATGVEHLDTILQPCTNVEPGRGNPCRNLELQEATIIDSHYLGGLSIIVGVPEAGLSGIGTSVLFRGLEVGTVIGMTLGTLLDHVTVAMYTSKCYQHLVRNNSVFQSASGYSLDFGLTGDVVKIGTFNQLIRGGIAFATPPDTLLAPEAQEGKRFLLQEDESKEWREQGAAFLK